MCVMMRVGVEPRSHGRRKNGA